MEDANNRRGKITPENKTEAELLLALWNNTIEERRARGLHTQSAFGAEYDIGNQAAVGFFLHGRTALSKKAARGFARGLGCSIADFSPRLAREIDELAQKFEGDRMRVLWPFPGIDPEKVRNLKESQLQQLQGALLMVSSQLNLDIQANPRPFEIRDRSREQQTQAA